MARQKLFPGKITESLLIKTAIEARLGRGPIHRLTRYRGMVSVGIAKHLQGWHFNKIQD